MTIFLEVLVTVFGTIMSLAYIPQGFKILKNKSSKNISLLTFSILWIGVLIWTIYGFSISNFPIVFANIVGLLGISFVIVCYFMYRKN